MATQAACWSRFFFSRHALSASHGLSRWSRTVWKTSHPFIAVYTYIYTSSVFILDEFRRRPERSRATLIKRQLIDSREMRGPSMIKNHKWLVGSRLTGGLIFYRECSRATITQARLLKSPLLECNRRGRNEKMQARLDRTRSTRLLFFFLSFVVFTCIRRGDNRYICKFFIDSS